MNQKIGNHGNNNNRQHISELTEEQQQQQRQQQQQHPELTEEEYNQQQQQEQQERDRRQPSIVSMLGNIRAYIQDSIRDISLSPESSKNPQDRVLIKLLTNNMKEFDSYIGLHLKEALKKHFGSEFSWNVQLDTQVKPILDPHSDRKHEIRYRITQISWASGPPIHAVEYWLRQNYGRLLPSKEFDPTIYNRRIPFVGNRLTMSYKPLPIKEYKFRQIPVFISPIIHKVVEKQDMITTQVQAQTQPTQGGGGGGGQLQPVPLQQPQPPITVTKLYYQLEVKDPKLGFYDKYGGTPVRSLKIRDWTLDGALIKLQTAIESIYFYEENTPGNRARFNALQKYIINGPQHIMTMPKSKAEEQAEKAEEDAMFQEGEEVANTDGPPGGALNSIPEEEPVDFVDSKPPSEESIDHNYHNDEREDLTEEAEKESGEDVEETGDDGSAEARLTLTNNNSNNENVGYTIDDLMEADGIIAEQQQQQPLIKTIH